MNKAESKYFNTAARMDEALIDLLQKKDFAYITIREICNAAGVNRSTFYLHYENLCDLLEESVSHLHQRFLSYFSEESESFISRLAGCRKEELLLISPRYLLPYLTFIRDHRTLYRAALDHPANFRAAESYQGLFTHVLNPILSRFSVPEAERPYIMAFYLSGISAVVEQWLKQDCQPDVQFVVDMIIKCIPSAHENRPES